jgi:hypothetical protein
MPSSQRSGTAPTGTPPTGSTPTTVVPRQGCDRCDHAAGPQRQDRDRWARVGAAPASRPLGVGGRGAGEQAAGGRVRGVGGRIVGAATWPGLGMPSDQVTQQTHAASATGSGARHRTGPYRPNPQASDGSEFLHPTSLTARRQSPRTQQGPRGRCRAGARHRRRGREGTGGTPPARLA